MTKMLAIWQILTSSYDHTWNLKGSHSKEIKIISEEIEDIKDQMKVL